MEVKNILSLSLILMFVTVVMMDIQPVQATNTYEYELYVDGFDWTIVNGWACYGTEPWLDDIDFPSCYIESSEYGGLIGSFTFENISLQPCEVISRVVLEGYIRSEDWEIDCDVFTPDLVWVGSLWGTWPSWAWHTPRWVGDLSEIVPDTLTEPGLNDFKVMLYYWTPTGGSHGLIQIDAMRLKVFTAVSAIIDLDPDVVKLSSNGPYMTCYITLQCGFSASDIDQSTIRLDGIISPVWCDTPTDSSLMVKFDMPTVKIHIVNYHLGGTPPPPNTLVYVELTITFSLNIGIPFEGSDIIGVRSCPKH